MKWTELSHFFSAFAPRKGMNCALSSDRNVSPWISLEVQEKKATMIQRVNSPKGAGREGVNCIFMAKIFLSPSWKTILHVSACLCWRLSFPGCLYRAQPWMTEIVPPSRAKGKVVYRPCHKDDICLWS